MKRTLILIAVLALIALATAAVIGAAYGHLLASDPDAQGTEDSTASPPDKIPPAEEYVPVFPGLAGTLQPTFAIDTDAECGLFQISVLLQESELDGVSAEVSDFTLADGVLTLTLRWNNETDKSIATGADFELFRSTNSPLEKKKDFPAASSSAAPHSSSVVRYVITDYYDIDSAQGTSYYTFKCHSERIYFSIAMIGSDVFSRADFDIDSDGRIETCTLGYGFTSGVSSYILSVREHGAGAFEYQSVWYPFATELAFAKDEEGNVRIRMKKAKESEPRLYNISILAGRLLVENNGVHHSGLGIPSDKLSRIEVTRYKNGTPEHMTVTSHETMLKLSSYLNLLGGSNRSSSTALPDTPLCIFHIYTEDKTEPYYTYTIWDENRYTTSMLGEQFDDLVICDRFVCEIMRYSDTLS